jgi:hypothetical protein
MTSEVSNVQMNATKSQSRGVSSDLSSEAILRRLDIVDELRELARDLKTSQRLGKLNSNERK